MRASLLPGDVTGPAVICAQAGEVNTGAFDPFPEIVAWARERDAWVHVDGAFGLWALADPSRAGSWAVDAHRWLNVPYDCGICLVRRPGGSPAETDRGYGDAAGPAPVSRPSRAGACPGCAQPRCG